MELEFCVLLLGCLFSFFCKRLVDNKYSRNDKKVRNVFLDLLFTSMLQGKTKFKDVSMDPKMITTNFFSREILLF